MVRKLVSESLSVNPWSNWKVASSMDFTEASLWYYTVSSLMLWVPRAWSTIIKFADDG